MRLGLCSIKESIHCEQKKWGKEKPWENSCRLSACHQSYDQCRTLALSNNCHSISWHTTSILHLVAAQAIYYSTFRLRGIFSSVKFCDTFFCTCKLEAVKYSEQDGPTNQ